MLDGSATGAAPHPYLNGDSTRRVQQVASATAAAATAAAVEFLSIASH